MFSKNVWLITFLCASTSHCFQPAATVLGDGSKYFLHPDPDDTTSNKAKIYEASRDNGQGEPEGDTVVVKLSPHRERLERENANYDRVSNDKHFVEKIDYMPDVVNTEESMGQDHGALVLEKGDQDLRDYVRTNGALQGEDLRLVAKTAAKCIKAVHDAGMVWTEVKARNFVVVEMEDRGRKRVKGIDLEAAVPRGNRPLDWTPETFPPEFATAFLCGKEPETEMDYSFDIWSYGMILWEMAHGEPYFDDRGAHVEIAQHLRSLEDRPTHAHGNVNPEVLDLIYWCLSVDPSKRPTIQQVVDHPFLSQSLTSA